MIAAVLSITLLGAILGIILGVANRFLQVEGNPIVEELLAMMPGSNCGQCGFPGAHIGARTLYIHDRETGPTRQLRTGYAC